MCIWRQGLRTRDRLKALTAWNPPKINLQTQVTGAF